MHERSKWNIIVFLSGVLGVVVADRLSKHFFSHLLGLNESISVIPHVLRFSLVHNTGIAFGLFKDSGVVFIIIPLILIGLLVYLNVYFFPRHREIEVSRLHIIAFSLVLGGAIGNLIDRIFLGYVIDFIDFRVWPVFNIADSAITIGAVILLFKSIASKQ